MDKFDIWAQEPDPLVEEAYSQDNYKVVDYSNGIKRCFIFFSSSGIYYPNTKEEFEEKIIRRDRYEWENLAAGEALSKASDKQIFVRDIFKQWYIRGINKTINTIDKLIELLRDLTRGYEVITVGISAGGYMAAIVAARLDARSCYDFSGQTSLWEKVDPNPLLRSKAVDDSDTKYFAVADLVKQSNCHFYYFYASGCDEDRNSWEALEDCPNTYGFGFPYKKHAATMFIWNMPYVIIKSREEMDKLAECYKGRKVNPLWFSFRTMPLSKAVCGLIRKAWKVFRSTLRKDH